MSDYVIALLDGDLTIVRTFEDLEMILELPDIEEAELFTESGQPFKATMVPTYGPRLLGLKRCVTGYRNQYRQTERTEDSDTRFRIALNSRIGCHLVVRHPAKLNRPVCLSPSQVARLEGELAINLPEPYKKLMAGPYPLREFPACTVYELFDDVDDLMTLNLAMRFREHLGQKWPAQCFCIGRDENLSTLYLDSALDAAPVMSLSCDGEITEVAPSLEFWISERLEELRRLKEMKASRSVLGRMRRLVGM